MSLDVAELADFKGDWLNNSWMLMEWLSAALGDQATEHDDEYQRSIFFWWLYENLAGYEDRQVIYFGSPGTGKTWKAEQVAQTRIKSWHLQYDSSEETRSRIGNQLERVQFHPSYGYEDFIEGIRPVGASEGRIQLSLRDGIFKQLCRRAARWEVNFVQSTGIGISDRTTVGDVHDRRSDLDPALWSFFSKGLPSSDRIIDNIPPYFLIIDEINRAELSRVMGELMFSLEYRGSANKLKTQYAELVKDGQDDSAFLFDRNSNTNYFFVPYNLYFYGTMNTIDRSVESFDFALRRRFRWEELAFDEAAARAILEDSGVNEQASASIMAAIGRLNRSISDDKFLGPDYCVGHAYLKHMAEYRGPKAIRAYLQFLWHTRFEPLLREYFRGSASPSTLRTRVGAFRDDFFG
jgi:5-methylcytosine-specific restriction protein B